MKSYIVIGLGRFGQTLARQLCALGAEGLAIDKRADLVQQVADDVTHAVVGDGQDKEVLRALKYWEKRKLLDLDFDEDKNLEGIHIHDLTEQGRPEPKTSGSSSGCKEFYPDKAPASVTFPMPSLQPEPDAGFTKPSYSADQLREFKKRKNIEQLLFVAVLFYGLKRHIQSFHRVRECTHRDEVHSLLLGRTAFFR